MEENTTIDNPDEALMSTTSIQDESTDGNPNEIMETTSAPAEGEQTYTTQGTENTNASEVTANNVPVIAAAVAGVVLLGAAALLVRRFALKR